MEELKLFFKRLIESGYIYLYVKVIIIFNEIESELFYVFLVLS